MSINVYFYFHVFTLLSAQIITGQVSGGSGEGPAPLFLDQTEARRAEKMFLWRPPLPPPPYLNTVGAINMLFFLLLLQDILDLRIYWVYRVYKIYRSLLFTSSIPFLDIIIKRCPNNTFATSIYRKKKYVYWPLY